MYNKCPICDGKRTVQLEIKSFICPYCRGCGRDIYPEWSYEKKLSMLNLISNKPIDEFKKAVDIIHVPTPPLKQSRGRPKKSKG